MSAYRPKSLAWLGDGKKGNMKMMHFDASYKSNSVLSSIFMEGMLLARYYQNRFRNKFHYTLIKLCKNKAISL
jgi:hypothetical protein